MNKKSKCKATKVDDTYACTSILAQIQAYILQYQSVYRSERNAKSMNYISVRCFGKSVLFLVQKKA